MGERGRKEKEGRGEKGLVRKGGRKDTSKRRREEGLPFPSQYGCLNPGPGHLSLDIKMSR